MWLHFTTIFKISLVLQNSVSAYFSYEVYPTVTILKLFLRKFFLISSSTLEGFQIILFWKLCRYSSLNICVHLILWLHSFCCVFDLFQHLPCGNNDVVWNADTKLLFCLFFIVYCFCFCFFLIDIPPFTSFKLCQWFWWDCFKEWFETGCYQSHWFRGLYWKEMGFLCWDSIVAVGFKL